MPPPDDPPQSPQDSDGETNQDNISNPKLRQTSPSPSIKSPLASIASFSYRQSNASLSQLFQSTTSLPSATISNSNSGTATPTGAAAVNGSTFSPAASTRAGSPAQVQTSSHGSGLVRDLILKAFAPHISVLASDDAEELVRHKGINGGLLELLRPFGESVQGKVTIRDSSGSSLSWDDYAVKFMGVRDGLESPRMGDRRSTDSSSSRKYGHQRLPSVEYKPARLRSGGDVAQIEDLVERHLTFADEHSGPVDYISHKEQAARTSAQSDSPFYILYLRRMLSGMPMVPSESMSQPVATVIAISSRSKSPIEELRNLFAASNTGEHRLPPWVLNEFLRYYILIHDEDYDDIQKSMALFDQMKRHFGLHCHLLRLRSTQCVASDDESLRLPRCQWISAAEELAEITHRASNEDDEDDTPYIFESDATAIRAFVREMVTQSVIPSMERASTTWNDQVASRRRGISGRFMSLSKRITTFGGRSSAPTGGPTGSNYDSVQGFYRPDAPEAVMRRLADYSLMLRDFRLAQSTFEILCSDYKNDKAWRYYAGANEMAAVSGLLMLGSGASNTKLRSDTVDQYLEAAHYSYITRVGSPYHALRALLLGVELLKPRNGTALDDAAKWLSRVLDDRLTGSVGHALILERIAKCYAERKSIGGVHGGKRRRKAAFWYALAGEAWLRLEKTGQAEKCISEAVRLYGSDQGIAGLVGIQQFLSQLHSAVSANRAGPKPFIDMQRPDAASEQTLVETLQDQPGFAPRSSAQIHRKSLSSASAKVSVLDTSSDVDPLGALPVDQSRQVMVGQRRDDGFE